MKKYIVKLTPQERENLKQLISSGKQSARRMTHARILLKADESEAGDGWKDEQIAAALDIGLSTIYRVRQRLVEEGVEAAVAGHKPGKPRERRLDARAEAHLIALACTKAPEGRKSWTLQMLADAMVEQGHVETLSYETVRQALKKTNSSPG